MIEFLGDCLCIAGKCFIGLGLIAVGLVTVGVVLDEVRRWHASRPW